MVLGEIMSHLLTAADAARCAFCPTPARKAPGPKAPVVVALQVSQASSTGFVSRPITQPPAASQLQDGSCRTPTLLSP